MADNEDRFGESPPAAQAKEQDGAAPEVIVVHDSSDDTTTASAPPPPPTATTTNAADPAADLDNAMNEKNKNDNDANKNNGEVDAATVADDQQEPKNKEAQLDGNDQQETTAAVAAAAAAAAAQKATTTSSHNATNPLDTSKHLNSDTATTATAGAGGTDEKADSNAPMVENTNGKTGVAEQEATKDDRTEQQQEQQQDDRKIIVQENDVVPEESNAVLEVVEAAAKKDHHGAAAAVTASTTATDVDGEQTTTEPPFQQQQDSFSASTSEMVVEMMHPNNSDISAASSSPPSVPQPPPRVSSEELRDNPNQLDENQDVDMDDVIVVDKDDNTKMEVVEEFKDDDSITDGDEDESDFFQQLRRTNKTKTNPKHLLPRKVQRRPTKTKPPSISIKIHSISAAINEVSPPTSPRGIHDDRQDLYDESMTRNDDYEYEYDDDYYVDEQDDDDSELALSFYQETHEDQDPSYQQLQRKSQIAKLQLKLQQIDHEDRISRQEIDDFIRSQLDEKQKSTSMSLEKYKIRAEADQTRDLQRLQQLYEQKVQSNNQRIQKGIQMLRERHSKELQALQQRLQQQGQMPSFPQAQAQLTAKKQRQLAEFTAKGEEVKKKTETDYRTQIEKIKNTHVQRVQEIQSNRKKILEKLMVSFQQVRQRYLKRHLQRIMKQKETCLGAIQQLSQQMVSASAMATDVPSSSTPGGTAAITSTASIPSSPTKRMNLDRTPSFASTAASAVGLESGAGGGSSNEDKAEFRQPSPIKSMQPWVHELDQVAGAAARHKHRKAIMSQVTRQLSVEIHNEGLWVSVNDGQPSSTTGASLEDSSRSTPNNNSNNSNAKEEEFLLWGTRAHAVLESIVCGEIPPGYDRFDTWGNGDGSSSSSTSALVSAQGGQIRCVITDLRASDETASIQRAQSVRDFEASQIDDLEAKGQELHTAVTETEDAIAKLQEKEKEGDAAIENAALGVEKAKRMKEEFTTKFRNYIGADGNVVQTPNPNDRQELQKALQNYNTNVDNAMRRESAAQQVLGEIKVRIQKLQAMAKTSQKNFSVVASMLKKRKAIAQATRAEAERRARTMDWSEPEKLPSLRVKDVISCLRKTAEKRRENMNEKKSGSVGSTWIQSFPDLPTALKKSLWHKMHRRKQQIVLRPTQESIMNQLRTRITENFNAQPGRSTATLEEEMIKAEQLFLLACHPFQKEPTSSVPITKSGENWAEPGWHLILDVNETESDDSRILPRQPSYPLLEKNISEIASAPGRQAASLLKPSHFRCLASPLSTVAIASSPAENGGIIPAKAAAAAAALGDPLFISEENISSRYSFSMTKPSTLKPPVARRKSSASEVSRADISAEATSAKSHSASHTAASTESTPRKEARAKVEPAKEQQRKGDAKRRRSSKGGGGGDAPSSRQRKNPPDASASKPSDLTASPRLAHRDSSRLTDESQIAAAAVAAAAAAAAAHYNQLMNKMPQQQGNVQQQVPASHQQQFAPQNQTRQQTQGAAPSQFQNAQQRQFAQMRMMQQQAQSPHRPPMPANFSPQPMPMQQFYNPLNHPGTPGRGSFSQQPPQNLPRIHMQARQAVPVPPQQVQTSTTGQHTQHLHQRQQQQHEHQPSLPQASQQQQQPQNQEGASQGADSQNDPLFMLN